MNARDKELIVAILDALYELSPDVIYKWIEDMDYVYKDDIEDYRMENRPF